MVASDRSLREIAVLRPRSLDALLNVHGVGEARAEKYGRAWLDIVAKQVGDATSRSERVDTKDEARTADAPSIEPR